MMSQKVQNLFSPCRETIKKHIEIFLTGHDYTDGRIEISTLTSSSYFGHSEIDEAVEHAFFTNSGGKNVYISGALFDPDSPPFGRSTDSDFYASCMVWADIDDPHDSEALKSLYSHCKPTHAVITAKIPHRRVQLWWKLSEAVTDKEALAEALSGIVDNLNSDPKVKNITSLMRLAGTINYPTEKKQAQGRIIELTQFADTGARAVTIDDIITAYPCSNEPFLQNTIKEVLRPDISQDNDKYHIQGFDMRLKDGRESYMSDLVYATILNYSEDHGAWPDEATVLNEVWPVYERKVISLSPGGLDKEDRGIKAMRQKIRNKLRLFNAGRVRGHSLPTKISKSQETIDPITGEITSINSDFNIQDWSVRNKFKGQAPEMEWLIEGILPAQAPMMLAAIGGIGKSFKMLEIALSVSCCVSSNGIIQKRILGGPITKYGNTVIITAEDSESSIHRRLNKIDPEEKRNAGQYQTYIVPTSELKQGTAPIISQTNDGMKVTEFYNALFNQLKDIPDLRLVVIDPLQAFVDGDISSSNEVAQAVFSRCIIPLSTQLKCTVLVIHHMNKEGGLGRILTARDARKAIRGVTGLVDGGRGTYCLWEPADDVKVALAAYFGEDKDPENFAQGAVVKFNDEHNHEITTFYRGENGVLEDMGHVDILGAGVITLTNEQAGNALREIRMAWESGNPYRATPQSPRCIVKWLMKTFNIKKQQAIWQRDNWLCPPLGSAPLIEERSFKDENRNSKLGLYVKHIP